MPQVPAGLRPMSEFDPDNPAILRKRQTGKIVTWTGERALEYVAHAELQPDGTVEFDGTVYDGWGNVLGG